MGQSAACRDQQPFPQVRALLRRVVDLTHHNTNRFVLVEGPLIAVRAVANRGGVQVAEPDGGTRT
jgi:hypothetical protein